MYGTRRCFSDIAKDEYSFSDNQDMVSVFIFALSDVLANGIGHAIMNMKFSIFIAATCVWHSNEVNK